MAELLYRILELEVVNTWVQALETNVQAARDRLRDHQEKFDNLFKEVHSVSDLCISWINEESLYWTSPPNNSRCERWLWRENRIMHGEYTLPRDNQDSEPIGWIRGHTKTDPVRQVRVTCCFDQHGTEILAPSMSSKGSFSSIVISRGPHRHEDESWQDQEDPPQDVEMVSCTSVEQSHAKTSRIEEIHASKQQAQSIPMDSLSEEFIQIDGAKWNDSVAWNIPKRLTVLERHRELDRELMKQFIGFFSEATT